MSWLLIFAIALIVFFNRYVFLDPHVPIKIPNLLNQALKYSAPCLLTAVCGPIILMDQGEIRSFPDNPYLWGAILSVITAYLLKNMIVSVLVSLVLFYLLCAVLY